MRGQQVSHYRLTQKLGAGTYGEVWKGVHVDDPDFTVAVKLVSPMMQQDPTFLDALRKECRALDRLDHPSIVRFRDLVVQDQTVAMVLELLEGTDLEALLATGPQPVEDVVHMVERVLEGLAYAHAMGVLHRDIKPGNLFRCTDGRVKLMDFGIARAADGTIATQTGTLVGTLDYMAPERFANQTTASADVYALGLVAWELLTGRRAAPEGDLAAKMGWHHAIGLPDVRTIRRDCPSWLADAVAALGTRDPAARPPDGTAALALWHAAVGDERRPTPGGAPTPHAPSTVRLPSTTPSLQPPAWKGGPQTLQPAGHPGTVQVHTGNLRPPSSRSDRDPHGHAIPADTVQPPPPDPAPSDRPPPSPRGKKALVVGLALGLMLTLMAVIGAGGWLAYGEVQRRLVVDDWVRFGGGKFQMGSNQGLANEAPAHPVRVAAFELMKTEVTVAQYRACVTAGACTSTVGNFCNWDQSNREDHPINCVRRQQAQDFARWVGARLPTEAEWEFAARSAHKRWRFPWGNEDLVCGREPVPGCGVLHTLPVCSVSARDTAQGVCDLGGNLSELVQDNWNDSHTDAPKSGKARRGGSGAMVRGCSWYDSGESCRASRRSQYPTYSTNLVGFRLARTLR